MNLLPKTALVLPDVKISRLGLGTVKFGRNTGVKYPTEFALPEMKTLRELMAVCKDAGINLLDTAPAYGLSEARLGELLQGERQDWVIVGKAGEYFEDGQSHFDFTEAGIITSVENSLRKLKTDYLDVLLIHSDGRDEEIIRQYAVFETLATLKKSGKIRLGGMSTKTIAGGLLTVKYSDVAMVTYRPDYQDELPVIEAAAKAGKGILLKKALASGHLTQLPGEDPIQATLDFIFKTPGVASVIIGTINPKHLDELVNKMLKAL